MKQIRRLKRVSEEKFKLFEETSKKGKYHPIRKSFVKIYHLPVKILVTIDIFYRSHQLKNNST